ncbi:MAG: hypothetical protein CL847_01640 [Crocinitomicaceae bacterium]|nr:hypothetical protein [Crocinitomicaceae bacterium]|tara:strand:+ start:7153 stop:9084 length:1932 start_codon:yes stop_codon:yes gene_type:complete
MRTITKIFFAILAIQFAFNSAICQEIERDLKFVPSEKDRFNQDGTVIRGGAPAMGLPFLDDFAWPSFFEESADGDYSLVRWDSSPVRRTQTFSLNTPTIGVATLDGLDAGGYPYQFNSIDAHNWADTLTSRKIYLEGMTPSDEVTLSFWFQGGGVGNAPDEQEDTLIVEFKSLGLEGDIWTRVWEQDGLESDEFTQVVIPITDGVYLHDSFQFRFRNYGTMMGNADLWHIDYVYVATGGATGNPVEELAFREPAYSLLRWFSAMPWTHFESNPEFYMEDTLHIESNNFGSGPNNQENTGITVRHAIPSAVPNEYTNEFIQNVSVPVGPFSTEFLADLLNESGAQTDLIFDTSVSDSIATFEVSLWEEEVGIYTDQTTVFDNDSIGFNQVFSNYYAYDDGSAEKAYALDAAGGQLAVRYPLAITDTLDGVLIHFTPFYENAEEETFVLKVWEDDAGVPGDMIDTMYQFHTPMYFTEGYDMFAYYPMDNPVPVSGTIHVGIIQQDIDRLNIGLDKTTNSNAGNLHYKLGPGFNWTLSGIEGSLMIRPVLRAGTDFVQDVGDNDVPSMSLISNPYPNPTSYSLSFNCSRNLDWDIFDINGKLIESGQESKGSSTLDVRYLTNGVYILRATIPNGEGVERHRFVIQY